MVGITIKPLTAALPLIGTKLIGDTTDTNSPSGGEDLTDALDQLKKLSTQNPMERIKEAVLKSHHLTDDQYNALPPSQRDAITKEIVENAKRQLPGAAASPQIAKGNAVDIQA